MAHTRRTRIAVLTALAGGAIALYAGATRGQGGAAPMPNTLSDAEKKDGWLLLFDGKSLDGWRGFQMQGIPAGWTVEDGAIHFVPPKETAAGSIAPGATATAGASSEPQRADLITVKQYQDFELQIEWAISAGGNSGIFFHVSETTPRTYETGPEFQVLDNAGHQDGKKPETTAGSNYALHAPVKDVTFPVGAWNQARIKVFGPRVTHTMNGTKLLEYTLWSPEWKALVAKSKFGAMPEYGLNKTGHIALQDHGNEVKYRNIKIRPL
jgi:hypothetical protein